MDTMTIVSVVKAIISLLGMGTMGVWFTAILSIMGVALLFWLRKYRRDEAARKTEQHQAEDDASAKVQNDHVSDSWAEAGNQVDRAKEEIRRKRQGY